MSSADADEVTEDYASFNREYFANLYEQEKMLSDKQRMNFYHHLIESRIGKGQRVLDLGTGTGILSAWASRRGALVTAIDHSERMIVLAQKLLSANGIENTKFVHCHSSEYSVKKNERFDVILHEQMGDILFDEDMVANVCDARNRLLRPGGVILPNDFLLYCDPVKLDDARNVANIWKNSIHGVDFSSFVTDQPNPDLDPGYYHFRSCDPSLVDYHLCDSHHIIDFKLETIQEDFLPKSVSFSRQIKKAGRMDGFAVYFKVVLDEKTSLCTGPKDNNRAVHWGYRILRANNDAVAMVNEGDTMHVSLSVEAWEDLDTWRWSYSVDKNGEAAREKSHCAHHPSSAKDVEILAASGKSSKRKNRIESADTSSGNSVKIVAGSRNGKKSSQRSDNSDSNDRSTGAGSGTTHIFNKPEAVEFLTMEELSRLRSTGQQETSTYSLKKLKPNKHK
jgi:protein arginine N-methyltransferase 1